ncbi:MAG: hypothetical protein WCF57_02500 [Pyrinomonadaceae bacterium]
MRPKTETHRSRFIRSLAAIIFFAGLPVAHAKDAGDKCQGMNERAATLIGQYKELRERRRRLPEGAYDKDLRDHEGKLHEVLSSLGVELGHPPFTKANIVGCLGEPDAIRNDKKMGHLLEIYHRELRKAGREVEKKSGREYLIYFWRGWHDFVFFISEEGRIVDHGWWFAYE